MHTGPRILHSEQHPIAQSAHKAEGHHDRQQGDTQQDGAEGQQDVREADPDQRRGHEQNQGQERQVAQEQAGVGGVTRPGTRRSSSDLGPHPPSREDPAAVGKRTLEAEVPEPENAAEEDGALTRDGAREPDSPAVVGVVAEPSPGPGSCPCTRPGGAARDPDLT